MKDPELTALARRVGRMRDIEQVRALMYAARAERHAHATQCAHCDFGGDYPHLCEEAERLNGVYGIYTHRLGVLSHRAG